MAVRSVVEAEDRQHAHDLHAGRVERHEDLRLLLVAGFDVSVLPIRMPILQRGSPTPTTTTCGR